MIFGAKAQVLEYTMFPKGICSFFRLNVKTLTEAVLPLVQKLWKMCVNPTKEIYEIRRVPVE